MLFHYLLFFKQGLLVAGGLTYGAYLSSTEIYLPSNNQWTAEKSLPRFHFAKAPLYFIKKRFQCCSLFTVVEKKGFPRGLYGLRAARLNGEVVVTGGWDRTNNVRDEVLFEIILVVLFLFQVYQYSPAEDEWTKIGTMERKHYYHAIVEANLRAVCPEISIISYI